MSESPPGPYLYEEGPEPIHTAVSARTRHVVIALVFGGTALLAVLLVVLLPLVTGTAAKQSRDAVTVFLKADAAGDTGTSYALLCDSERARITQADVARDYIGRTPGSIVSVTGRHVDGTPQELVVVRWADGSESTYTVINQGGPHLCGVHPGG